MSVSLGTKGSIVFTGSTGKAVTLTAPSSVSDNVSYSIGQKRVVALDDSADAVARTLVAGDSGTLFTLKDGTKGIAIILPAATAGTEFDFSVISAKLADGVSATITTPAAANILYGMKVEGTTSTAISAKNKLTLVKDTATVGTHIRMVCDGTSWLTFVRSPSAGGVTEA